MHFKPVLLWTDVVLLALLAGVLLLARQAGRADRRATWRRVFVQPPALCAAIVLAFFFAIALLDSLHFRRALPPVAHPAKTASAEPAGTAYDARTESLLDVSLARLVASREATYSRPLAWQGFTKETRQLNGVAVREFPRLVHAGAGLADPATRAGPDQWRRAALGAGAGALLALAAAAALARWLAAAQGQRWSQAWGDLWHGRTALPWRAGVCTLLALCMLVGAGCALGAAWHVFGTDRTGNDVLYQALKSVRTAFVIGALATIATLPFAVLLGVAAGYFGGWVDAVISYLYTMLSSVPNVLLIAACVLMVQVFLDSHPAAFETGAERADLRVFLLCVILGVTGWAGLCRLLRAETLKLRELDYVQAATAFGVGPWRTIARHIVPNVLHLVLITTVLDFSGLILYEAVLSYVGVGVDPSMNSFGGMINLARSEMSRAPVVWWSFAAAFAFMVALVLAANLFADGVRDAFDPRARLFRPRRGMRRLPGVGQ